RGVAASGLDVYATFAPSGPTTEGAATSELRRYRDGQPAGTVGVAGIAGELVVAGELVAVATSGTGSLALAGGELALRGDPGAVLVAVTPGGEPRWRLAFDSTEWALITSLATIESDVLVAGSFGGTLRVASRVVTSAGGSD